MSKLKFDESLKQLNKIVESLENPGLELEKSLELFKMGKDLIKDLETQLIDIDKKVSEIINEDEAK